MPRSLARLALTLTASLGLLAMAALPALAADAATKPTPGEDDYLIGSMAQLGIAAILGALLGVYAFVTRPKLAEVDDDHAHH